MAGSVTTFKPLVFFLLIGGMAIGMFLAQPRVSELPAYLVAQEGDFGDGPGDVGADEPEECDTCAPDEECICDENGENCGCGREPIYCDVCGPLPQLPPEPVDDVRYITGCTQSNEEFYPDHDGCTRACPDGHWPPEDMCDGIPWEYDCKLNCASAEWTTCAIVQNDSCVEIAQWVTYSEECNLFMAQQDMPFGTEDDLDFYIGCLAGNPCRALDPATKSTGWCDLDEGDDGCWGAGQLNEVHTTMCGCCGIGDGDGYKYSCPDDALIQCCGGYSPAYGGCSRGRCPQGFGCGKAEGNTNNDPCQCIGNSCTNDSDCSGGCCDNGTCTTQGCASSSTPSSAVSSDPPGPGPGPGPGAACGDNADCDTGCCQGGNCVQVTCQPGEIRNGCICMPFLQCPGDGLCDKVPASNQGCDDVNPLCPTGLIANTLPGNCGQPVACNGGCYECVQCLNDGDCSTGCCSGDNVCTVCPESSSSSSEDSSEESSVPSSVVSSDDSSVDSSAISSQESSSSSFDICCDTATLSCTPFGSCNGGFPTMDACLAVCGVESSSSSGGAGVCCVNDQCMLTSCPLPYPNMPACQAECGASSSAESSEESSEESSSESSEESSVESSSEESSDLSSSEESESSSSFSTPLQICCENNQCVVGEDCDGWETIDECLAECLPSSSSSSAAQCGNGVIDPLTLQECTGGPPTSSVASSDTPVSSSQESSLGDEWVVCTDGYVCSHEYFKQGGAKSKKQCRETKHNLCNSVSNGKACGDSKCSGTCVKCGENDYCDSGFQCSCFGLAPKGCNPVSGGSCFVPILGCTGGCYQCTNTSNDSGLKGSAVEPPWCPGGYACLFDHPDFDDSTGNVPTDKLCEGIDIAGTCDNLAGERTSCYKCPSTSGEAAPEIPWQGCEGNYKCQYRYETEELFGGTAVRTCIEEPSFNGCVAEASGRTCGDGVCGGSCLRCAPSSRAKQLRGSFLSDFGSFLASLFDNIVASLTSLFSS